jgi:hypothetical protein
MDVTNDRYASIRMRALIMPRAGFAPDPESAPAEECQASAQPITDMALLISFKWYPALCGGMGNRQLTKHG